jgi:DNA-binding transcriptional regulator YdaS (Cro superfamily)
MEVSANKIIDRLGGTYATARLCDVAPPSVSEWRTRNAIPKARLMFIKLARPDVFVSKPDEKAA